MAASQPPTVGEFVTATAVGLGLGGFQVMLFRLFMIEPVRQVVGIGAVMLATALVLRVSLPGVLGWKRRAT